MILAATLFAALFVTVSVALSVQAVGELVRMAFAGELRC